MKASLHIGVIDDEDLQRRQLARLVEERIAVLAPDTPAVIEDFACASDLVAAMRSGMSLDILLADIVLDADHAGLPSGEACAYDEDASALDRAGSSAATSIDAVKKLMLAERGVQVIYVTGYDQYHTRAYETEHTCFLIKPIRCAELDFALQRALDRIACTVREPLRIRWGAEEHIVAPSEIIYIESARRVLIIHTVHGELRTYGKLSDFELRLPDEFVRCHKSFLVNMAQITMLQQSRVRLADGSTVPVSQSRRRATHDAVHAYARGT